MKWQCGVVGWWWSSGDAALPLNVQGGAGGLDPKTGN